MRFNYSIRENQLAVNITSGMLLQVSALMMMVLIIMALLICSTASAGSGKSLCNQTSETGITILNVHSYPALGDNWTVMFDTTGTADLTITATYDFNYSIETTKWSNECEDPALYDLTFLECINGNETHQYEWIGDNCPEKEYSVFIENYSCNKTSSIISKVLTAKPHILKFKFGNQEIFAYNDVVNKEVFLQGNYVEVGIHESCSFGTANAAPTGFHDIRRSQLGFVADIGKDGWTTGTPAQSGDYFLPGSPEEGWAIEWNYQGNVRTKWNFGRSGYFQMPKKSLTETSSGSTQSAVWEGTASNGVEKLDIVKTIHFNEDDLFFLINTVITNTGTVSLDSVEFMRNVDPDNEKDIGGSYTTINYIAYQPGVDGNTKKALVVAKGQRYSVTLGLGTIDSRAIVSTEGFSNRYPDYILDSPSSSCTKTNPCIADQAIALAYRFGTLAPGQSVTFDYAYILSGSDLETALGNLAAVTILQPTGTISGSNVVFQATTDDIPNTAQMEFFVDGSSIGIDTTPDTGDIFEKTFSSILYSDGTLNLKVMATYTDGRVFEKSSTVTVDNTGPPIEFLTPTIGQIFVGNIPIVITVLEESHPPVRVSFFRETASTGSTFLEEDTEAPFKSSFIVTDLPDNETVVIKAVAYDSLDKSTTIQVSGTTSPTAPLPLAPSILSSVPSSTFAADTIGTTRTFNIIVDQTVDIAWYINGSQVQTNDSVNASSYTNSNTIPGYWNVTSTVNNLNGQDIRTWWWCACQISE